VTTWHGAWVFPDSNAHGRGEQPQHLYTVVFDGIDLWGAAAEPGTAVSLDLFEPYLTAWTAEVDT
jgi:nitrile hydratase